MNCNDDLIKLRRSINTDIETEAKQFYLSDTHQPWVSPVICINIITWIVIVILSQNSLFIILMIDWQSSRFLIWWIPPRSFVGIWLVDCTNGFQKLWLWSRSILIYRHKQTKSTPLILQDELYAACIGVENIGLKSWSLPHGTSLQFLLSLYCCWLCYLSQKP
jgi:hypothetical protein